ncbi:ercc4 domain-containing protein [Ophiostoma piceae UAMH 11346]|uniref:Ercc4 domain-containing protein n=1 Tax=Ophiostoma piceae (strain UAMH 11346) TaxID=1262450 RepID=S3CKS8_OPHP1|nr:ercc4 domain-containing protein [Ophiostoma piceae UAMH 11346]
MMAEDCVILLSSDESDAFVTPHKPAPVTRQYDLDDDDDDDDFLGERLQARVSTLTAAASGQAISTVAHTAASRTGRSDAWDGGGSPKRPIAARLGVAVSSTSTAQSSNTNRAAAVLIIDDTPIQISSSSTRNSDAHKARRLEAAAPGYSGFSSDEINSSPFPNPTFTQQEPAQSRPVAIGGRDTKAVANNGISPLVRASRAFTDFTDCFDDDDSGLEQNRPSKRPRLSPKPATGTFSAAIRSSPRLSLARHITPNILFPAQPSRSTFTMDDSDDDMGDTIAPEPLPILRDKTQKEKASKAGAECIDLLTSSDAETGHTFPKVAGETDAEFVDIDDLLKNPSTPKKAPASPPTPRRRLESSAEIMLLSSSPPSHARQTTPNSIPRETNPAGRVSARAAPRPQARKSMQRSFSEGHALVFDDDDDDDDIEVWGNGSQGAEDLLAAWRKDPPPQVPARPQPGARDNMSPSRRRSSFDITASTITSKARARPGSSNQSALTTPATPDADKEARRREREATREEKRKEKEAEKERRQREREVEKERRKINADMAREKKAYERAEAAAFNNANRSRVDKSAAAPEMIVRLPMTLPQATKEITEGLLGEIKSNSEMWKSPLLDNVVTWRRKVTAEYKPDLGHWVPVQERIEDEKHAMAVFRAEDLVKLILAAQDPEVKQQMSGYDLESHLRAMKRTFSRHTIIYLVEGLHAWKSKNRTIRNRQFAEAVRNAGGSTTTNGSTASTPAGAAALAALNRSRQSGQPDEPVAAAARPSHRLGRRGQQRPPQHLDEAVVDDAMLELQMGFDDDDDDDDYDNGDGDGGNDRPKTRIMVHETQSSLDTARWIKIFTEQIATGRYRRLKEELYAASASFCMDSGQIATGDGGSETYVLMLQQIARVTEPVALGVAARYGTLPKLVRGFRDEGPLALEACLKSRNRNGALSDRTVGQALSRRIYKVLMGTDEASTDV